VRRAHRTAALTGALAGVALCIGALAPAVGLSGAASSAGAAVLPRVTLPQSVPTLPANVARLGTTPASAVLHLDMALAGQDPSGLAAAVNAVSTPGSPEYRHYLTQAQFAAEFGPSAAEVAQVTAALHTEGLTVGTPDPGSLLLPVSGTAAVVSSALGTALQTVHAPGQSANAIVNTTAPSIPSSLAGEVTGVVGLDGLFHEHAMLRTRMPHVAPAPSASPSTTTTPNTPSTPAVPAPQSHALARATPPQACAAASSAGGGGLYTSTQLASIYTLDQLFNQGRTGIGQTIAIVEFEQYSLSDFDNFQACYGLSNSIRDVSIDGGPGGPAAGMGEAALDTELAAVSAPSASLVVYEAPNGATDTSAVDLLNRIASDDTAQVVTTSWGDCEANLTSNDLQTENQIFQRMALQGQTMIAASGDSGSEDCFGFGNANTNLAVDDPGSQPDVLSAGGTALATPSASSQTVWNNCLDSLTGDQCASTSSNGQLVNGSGGGGYSSVWPRPSYQPGLNANRAVPDLVMAADPEAGGVIAFWNGGWIGFGGTSIAAPSNAGFFVDTNQGCYNRLGMAGPALYAAENGSNFTDIVSGNNDFTDTNSGQYNAVTGFDPASGLGSPVDQNLVTALQGGDGCPSVASVSPSAGPTIGGGAITVIGGGFGDATSVNFGVVGGGQIVSQTATTITVIPPNAAVPACVDVTVTNPLGVSAVSPADHYGFGGAGGCGQGYRFVASDGGVFDFGDASFWGSMGGTPLVRPVVGMAASPTSNGYWLVASDGGIFSFGDAQFYGSMGGRPLNKPIVGMAATPEGRGYWLVASDGGIFSFGNANFYGSTGNLRLNRPIVGMAATPDGGGYWLVASDGGIFSYGDAQFHGSTGALVLNSPIVGMAPSAGGNGYWLVASDGGIFSFGDANFWGSMGATRLNRPIVGMTSTPDAGGYWLVASDGGIFSFGDANFYGSTGNIPLNKPIVGMSGA
jgi:pro-kumamolisin-like protein/IPT/TIG domain-containing protein